MGSSWLHSCLPALLVVLVSHQVVTHKVLAQGPPESCSAATLSKISFGVGTSAYQVEGGANLDGRSPSVWDVFAKTSGRIDDKSTGDVATDFYHRYKEDIALMKSLGAENFRLSISWSRLIPKGSKGSAVNKKGLDFYNNVINELLDNGIQPIITLYHWDLPQSLQDSYKGFISPEIVDDFVYFADVAFGAFGDRVKKWSTFNEPMSICNLQYGNGDFAPGIKYGEPGKWQCGHYLLLAHGKTVQLFRTKYASQKGKIGMVIWAEWSEPFSNSEEDNRASQNKMDVEFGWFADVLHFGDYPQRLKQGKIAANLIPLTADEQKMLKGSYDYVGVTLYTGKYARSNGDPLGWRVSTIGPDGKLVGDRAQSYWLYDVPWALGRLLDYLDKRYGKPDIWLLESGFSEVGEGQKKGDAVLNDPGRLKYYRGYISEACKAVDRGVKFTHYIIWSFTDNWEWKEGYTTKYGIVHVDFSNSKLVRQVKDSGKWLSKYVFKSSSKA